MRTSLLGCFLRGLNTGRTLLRLEDFRRSSVQLIKIEAAKAYLRAVLLARTSVMGFMGLGLLLGCVILGMLLVHFALFALVPCALRTKAYLALGLGFSYLVLGMVGITLALRPRVWAESSGALDLLRDAAGSCES